MKRINYKKIVPADSFIGRYMEFMQAQETAVSYDFWSAVWLMSLALGRGTQVPRPRAPVFMNWYVLFVAESGVTRKSTAVRICTKMARRYFAAVEDDTILIETKTTPEALEFRLQEASRSVGHAHAAISISELVTFLGKERYTMQMPGLLTDLYDSPDLRAGGGTLSRGPGTVSNVFVSFLSASTPSWLMRSINPDVIEGGFTSRCMFVVSENRKKRIAWPDEEEGSVTQDTLVAELVRINGEAKRYNTVGLSDSGMKKYTSWYGTKAESDDPFRKSYESREDSHVLRLAACLAVNDGSWLINGEHIKKATGVIAEIKYDGSTIFNGGLRSDRVVIGIDKLREKLVEKGLEGITQTELFLHVRNFLSAEQYKTVLEIMHELQMVQRFEDTTNTTGRKANIWRATRLITAKSVMDTFYRRMEPQ